MTGAFDTFEDVGHVVEVEPWPHSAEVARLDDERLPGYGPSRGLKPEPERLIDDVLECPPRPAGA